MARKLIRAATVDLTFKQATILRGLIRVEALRLGWTPEMEVKPSTKLGELLTMDRKIRSGMQPGDFE